jgi:hypothetical protein
VADLIAVETAREGAVTGSTHENQAQSWQRFSKYLDSIGLSHDLYLESFTRSQRNKIIGAFAMALRQGQYSSKAYDTLALGTIRNTILDIYSTIWENGRPNPTKDKDLQLSFILQRQFRAFKNANPKEKQQKAIHACVIAKIAKRKLTELQCATLQLTIFAFFFAMRSCKYVKVTQQEKCRTEILRLQNLRFFNNGRLVPHNDPNLEYSNCLSITFEMQKKDKKNDTMTQMALGNITLCPVCAAAAIVRRIRSYPGANDDTPISAIWKYDCIEHITSRKISNALQDAVSAIGEDALHIATNEIRTHSIRSGAAMAMFLGSCPVFLIMMIGRWSSDAFLRYIRKQAKEFNHDVSRQMLTHMFHRHIPNYSSQTVSHLDPRQRNHPDNTETRNNVGGDAAQQARLPAFAQFH